jgi:hemin uptake protein HemP
MRFILIRMKDDTAQQTRMLAEPVLSTSAATESLRRFSSAALLQGQRQIVIEHAGREYRLRLTAQGKLILTA